MKLRKLFPLILSTLVMSNLTSCNIGSATPLSFNDFLLKYEKLLENRGNDYYLLTDLTYILNNETIFGSQTLMLSSNSSSGTMTIAPFDEQTIPVSFNNKAYLELAIRHLSFSSEAKQTYSTYSNNYTAEFEGNLLIGDIYCNGKLTVSINDIGFIYNVTYKGDYAGEYVEFLYKMENYKKVIFSNEDAFVKSYGDAINKREKDKAYNEIYYSSYIALEEENINSTYVSSEILYNNGFYYIQNEITSLFNAVCGFETTSALKEYIEKASSLSLFGYTDKYMVGFFAYADSKSATEFNHSAIAVFNSEGFVSFYFANGKYKNHDISYNLRTHSYISSSISMTQSEFVNSYGDAILHNRVANKANPYLTKAIGTFVENKENNIERVFNFGNYLLSQSGDNLRCFVPMYQYYGDVAVIFNSKDAFSETLNNLKEQFDEVEEKYSLTNSCLFGRINGISKDDPSKKVYIAFSYDKYGFASAFTTLTLNKNDGSLISSYNVSFKDYFYFAQNQISSAESIISSYKNAINNRTKTDFFTAYTYESNSDINDGLILPSLKQVIKNDGGLTFDSLNLYNINAMYNSESSFKTFMQSIDRLTNHSYFFISEHDYIIIRYLNSENNLHFTLCFNDVGFLTNYIVEDQNTSHPFVSTVNIVHYA